MIETVGRVASAEIKEEKNENVSTSVNMLSKKIVDILVDLLSEIQ